jgi:hypothetical protein
VHQSAAGYFHALGLTERFLTGGTVVSQPIHAKLLRPTDAARVIGVKTNTLREWRTADRERLRRG